MDIDAIVAEVAAAVGLAEGEAGVRDVLRVVARDEPAPTASISRAAELPVPIVTAVCSELRRRGVVDRTRPVRLTHQARERLAATAPRIETACSCCGGLGQVVPKEIAALGAELEPASAGAPQARLDLDQTHCTVATKIHRVLRLFAAGGFDGKRIVLLGDDDLVAVAIARFARLTGITAGIRRLAVIDADPAVLRWIGEQTAGTGLAVDLMEHDLRQPLPAGLTGAFDVACTDPPYTVAGAELFLSRAVSALQRRPGQHVFFSFGTRRPADGLATQRLIAGLGLVMRSLTPNFNSYQGAGILAGTSHLYHLRTSGEAAPLIDGEYQQPIYTADSRAERSRPYRCAGCGAIYLVGPSPADHKDRADTPGWEQISDLQAAGCPACGSVKFRPMPRRAGRP